MVTWKLCTIPGSNRIMLTFSSSFSLQNAKCKLQNVTFSTSKNPIIVHQILTQSSCRDWQHCCSTICEESFCSLHKKGPVYGFLNKKTLKMKKKSSPVFQCPIWSPRRQHRIQVHWKPTRTNQSKLFFKQKIPLQQTYVRWLDGTSGQPDLSSSWWQVLLPRKRAREPAHHLDS